MTLSTNSSDEILTTFQLRDEIVTTTSPYVTNLTISLFGVDLSFGLICMWCLLFGTTGNMLSLGFFVKKFRRTTENKVGTMIYAFIACCDMVICTLAGIIGFSYINSRKPTALGIPIMCNLWGSMWNIFPRLSVLLVALLSVTRAMVVYKPLQAISIRMIVRVMVLYLILQVVQAILPFTKGALYQYNDTIVICMWQITDVVKRGTFGYYFIWMFLLILQFALPVFPIIGSSIFCVYQLAKKKSTSRKYASVTVVIVTSVYILFNLPLAVYLISGFIGELTQYKVNVFRFDSRHMLLGNFLFNISVACNAFINPLIYFYRVNDMKAWLKNRCSKFFSLLYFKLTQNRSSSTMQLDSIHFTGNNLTNNHLHHI